MKCYNGDFIVSVEADGFYPESESTNRFSASYSEGKKRYVYTEKEKNLNYTLRRVKNPVAMKHTCCMAKRIPMKPGVYPFDLEVGDFVKPRGKGKIADLEVVFENAGPTPTNRVCKGFLRFSNGGAYVRPKIPSTSFQSEYEADTKETYISEFPFEYRFGRAENGGDLSKHPIDNSHYLVYRIREQRDADGKLISANYGKIYGKIETYGYMFYLNGFYNPAVNNTSIEATQRYGQ